MGKKKGNNYVIDNEKGIARIELKRRNRESLWTIVDLEDLDKILSFPYTWFSTFYKNVNGYYANASENISKGEGGKKKNRNVLLHKFVLNATKDNVDHINHNTLDNRKENLRIIKTRNNLTNRKTKNKNNKSGFRNVCRIDNQWSVQLQVDGKKTNLGKFPLDKLEEAAKFAEDMRKKYYGEFAGGS